MTDSNSVDYYRRREAREQNLAAAAINPAIAAIHRTMAAEYRALIEQACTAARA